MTDETTIKQGTHFFFKTGMYSDSSYYSCVTQRDISLEYAQEVQNYCATRLKEVKKAIEEMEGGYFHISSCAEYLIPLALMVKRGDVLYTPHIKTIGSSYSDTMELYTNEYEEENYVEALEFTNKYLS